jgi:hypothetical protein
MFVQQPEGKRNRFNLLVLSEGEHYFSDYSCVYYPPAKTEEESYKRYVPQPTKADLRFHSDANFQLQTNSPLVSRYIKHKFILQFCSLALWRVVVNFSCESQFFFFLPPNFGCFSRP